MSKKKYKINWKKFSVFILIVVLIIAAIVFIVSHFAGDKGSSSKVNPKKCTHSFENGVCTICGGSAQKYCKHTFEKGICTVCNMSSEGICNHSYKDGACINCGVPCVHNFEGDVCKICGQKKDPKTLWPYTTTAKNSYPLTNVTEDYLVHVNKTYHLTEAYVPDDMVVVDRYVEGIGDVSQYTNRMRKVAAEALNKMFDAAESEGLYLKLRTGYRSYSYQVNLFNNYARSYGDAAANLFSAKPGESEHQTGLACDLGAKSQGYVLSDYFGDTPEGKWVKDNCWKFGFILRYIDGDLETAGAHTGYTYEAWHIRYVGEEAAKIIYDNNWTFEEYLEAIESVM